MALRYVCLSWIRCLWFTQQVFIATHTAKVLYAYWFCDDNIYLELPGSSSNSMYTQHPRIPHGSSSAMLTISLATWFSSVEGRSTSVHAKCLDLAARSSDWRRPARARVVGLSWASPGKGGPLVGVVSPARWCLMSWLLLLLVSSVWWLWSRCWLVNDLWWWGLWGFGTGMAADRRGVIGVAQSAIDGNSVKLVGNI